jgi:peptidyl-prolyl cis-trans isomerase SurA
MKLSAAFVLLSVSVLAACASGPPTPSSPDVWAIVDGHEIRRQDVENAFKRVSQLPPGTPEEEVLAFKMNLLNEMILQELLIARAPGLGVAVTDADVDAAFDERRRNLPEDTFQKELTLRGLSADDMKDGLRRELLADKVIEHEVGPKVNVTEDEVSAYYDANRAQFNLPETAYRIAQIVITPVADQGLNNRLNDDATTPAAAERKAKMLTERLRNGERFSEVAMDYSEDPQTAPAGGDLGFVPVSALKQAPPMLRDAVLKAQPGSMNVLSQGGAHTLVLVIAREEAGQRELSDPNVRQGIADALRSRREQVLRAAYLNVVRGGAQVVHNLAQQVLASPADIRSLAPSAPGR